MDSPSAALLVSDWVQKRFVMVLFRDFPGNFQVFFDLKASTKYVRKLQTVTSVVHDGPPALDLADAGLVDLRTAFLRNFFQSSAPFATFSRG